MSKFVIEGYIKSFQTHKALIEHALKQLNNEGIHWQAFPESNTIAVLVKHIAGHLSSRFAHFWESDGERADRNRVQELSNEFLDKQQLLEIWESAWAIVFENLAMLEDSDLYKTKNLRGTPILIAAYIPRVLTHFTYHGGQIVWAAKQFLGTQWKGFDA